MENKKPAVLMIDGDNVPGSLADDICEAANTFGNVKSIHLFANFKNSDPSWNLATYRHAMHVHYFPVIVPKKNVTDMALAIEAMKTIYRHPEIDVVIIASNDTDYMPLAMEIRASGKEAVNLYTKKDGISQLEAYDRSAFVEKRQKTAEKQSGQNSQGTQQTQGSSKQDVFSKEAAKEETAKIEKSATADPNLSFAQSVFVTTNALIDEAVAKNKEPKVLLSVISQSLKKKDKSFNPKKSYKKCSGMKVMMQLLMDDYPKLFAGLELTNDNGIKRV